MRVIPIATWHAEISQHELREKRQVESHEDDERRQFAPPLLIHAARNLWPPEVQAGEIGNDHSTHHDVVEMRDDEIRVSHMNVYSERCEEQSGQSPHREQADEPESVQHGSVIGN